MRDAGTIAWENIRQDAYVLYIFPPFQTLRCALTFARAEKIIGIDQNPYFSFAVQDHIEPNFW